MRTMLYIIFIFFTADIAASGGLNLYERNQREAKCKRLKKKAQRKKRCYQEEDCDRFNYDGPIPDHLGDIDEVAEVDDIDEDW